MFEIGQYFMMKDTAEFSQFTDAVACREYTLPRDEETSEPKGCIQMEKCSKLQREAKNGHVVEGQRGENDSVAQARWWRARYRCWGRDPTIGLQDHRTADWESR